MIHVDFAKLRFLVVDDNAHMRRIVRTLLHGFGAREVREAEDGIEGLELFASHPPDIAIVDWFMPKLDGIEFVKAARRPENGHDPFAPIIMLTGHTGRSRVLRARDVGVTEFLCKPISARALYGRVLDCVLTPRPFLRTRDYFGPDHRRGGVPARAEPGRRADEARPADAAAGRPRQFAGH